MNESILTSIKAQLGIQEEYTAFDQQIVILLMLPYCAYDTSYKSENLYHDVLTLYF